MIPYHEADLLRQSFLLVCFFLLAVTIFRKHGTEHRSFNESFRNVESGVTECLNGAVDHIKYVPVYPLRKVMRFPSEVSGEAREGHSHRYSLTSRAPFKLNPAFAAT